MHTKSLVTLKQMLVERAGRKKARLALSPNSPAQGPGTMTTHGSSNGKQTGELDTARVGSDATSLEKVCSIAD
jgi:hypothetical protein